MSKAKHKKNCKIGALKKREENVGMEVNLEEKKKSNQNKIKHFFKVSRANEIR